MTAQTYVYRHFDKKGILLYVGIATNVAMRTSGHRLKSPWAKEIHSTTSKPYKTRMKAAIAELQAIDREKPLHNVVPGTERRRKFEDLIMISVRIPATLMQRTLLACKQSKMNKSAFVRSALEKALTVL